VEPNQIRNLITQAWGELKKPDTGETGLTYESPEAHNLLRRMNVFEFADQITKFDKEHLFCYLNIEYACYFCGGYMLFGLSEWFSDEGSEEFYDSLAEHLYYFFTGQRWPVKEIAARMSPAQIHAVYAFMKLSEEIFGRLSVIDSTKLLFPFAVVSWDLIDMGID
jgi:hypothetical protein